MLMFFCFLRIVNAGDKHDDVLLLKEIEASKCSIRPLKANTPFFSVSARFFLKNDTELFEEDIAIHWKNGSGGSITAPRPEKTWNSSAIHIYPVLDEPTRATLGVQVDEILFFELGLINEAADITPEEAQNIDFIAFKTLSTIIMVRQLGEMKTRKQISFTYVNQGGILREAFHISKIE